ncbi:hypothetical protein FB00_11870 [Cellulosimicrobium funkei]|uniref:Uncharacterized protein n=1 Tax=Cellulosimicrobium funkei TaxID=264251 RepID=A0A0H2KLY1_9MICO|nr:hypothetical protein FB00_11870 [Cellulosimicrobium funkei]
MSAETTTTATVTNAATQNRPVSHPRWSASHHDHQPPPQENPTTTNAAAPSSATSTLPRNASWRWMRPSRRSGSSAHAAPYRTSPAPERKNVTNRSPRTMSGSIPNRSATPDATPPIHRSSPR